MLSCSVASDSLWAHGLSPIRLLCPWGFSRQEYWSGLLCPPPENLLNLGIEPRSPTLQEDSSLSELPGKPFFKGRHQNHPGDGSGKKWTLSRCSYFKYSVEILGYFFLACIACKNVTGRVFYFKNYIRFMVIFYAKAGHQKLSVMLNVSRSLISFLGYSGWSKNWIDMRQINRKKSHLIMSV